jgi:NADH:ubiquinone oxidoreductase subunit F (NADH-binding)
MNAPAPVQGLPRLIMPGGPLALADHLDRYGPLPLPDGRGGSGWAGAGRLIAEVDRAGLVGRGGAAFPAGRKLRAVAGHSRGPGPRRAGAVVVANGAESEPASAKDKMLLTRAPHLVLDGIAAAADAVGASRGYLTLHAGSDELALQLAAAVAERAGLDPVPVEIVVGAGGYLASQETALISQLNAGPPKPSFVPPRPFQKGAHGRPTLVQNVETLAHIALIARFGADWFREVGYPGTAAGSVPEVQPGPGAAGSALVTVTGAVHGPGVYEIALGTPLGELVQRAGGPSEQPQAVLAGGYLGGWLPYPEALDVPLTDPALRAAGAAFGPGVLVLLGESACPLAETAWVASYLASQSARQCGPCLNGLPALAATLRQLAFGRPDARALGWAEQLMTLVTGRGACHLPDGTAKFVASALAVFSGELHRHASSGPCSRARRRPTLPAPGYGGSQQ